METVFPKRRDLLINPRGVNLEGRHLYHRENLKCFVMISFFNDALLTAELYCIVI